MKQTITTQQNTTPKKDLNMNKQMRKYAGAALTLCIIASSSVAFAASQAYEQNPVEQPRSYSNHDGVVTQGQSEKQAASVPSMSGHLETQVLQGDLHTSSDPLVGEFKEEIGGVVETQVKAVKLVEGVQAKFDKCEDEIGRSREDQVRYTTCLQNAAGEGERAFLNMLTELGVLNEKLDNYKSYLERKKKLYERDLQTEKENLAEVEEEITDLKQQAVNLKKTLTSVKPGEPLSPEQMHQINLLVDELNHNNRISSMYEHSVQFAQAELERWGNIVQVVATTKLSIQRNQTNAGYRVKEFDLYKTLVGKSLHSSDALDEGYNIVGLLSDASPTIAKVIGFTPPSPLPSPNSIPHPHPSEVQTAGDALKILNAILSGGNSNE